MNKTSIGAIFAATIVTILVSASYPFMALKLGLTPGMAIAGAVLGFIFMRGIGRMKTYDRHLNNCVQTCGTAGTSVAFMVVVIVALEWLGFNITAWQTFWWLFIAGSLGVVIAVPFRKQFIDVDNLKFPDGVAAAKILTVLDTHGEESSKQVRALAWPGAIAALFTFSRDIFPKWSEVSLFSGWRGTMFLGMDWSLMNIGVGMIIGPQVCLWMLFGSLATWDMFVPWLFDHGYVASFDFKAALRFTMWPATALLLAGGLTPFLLEWRQAIGVFKNIREAGRDGSEMSIRSVIITAAVLSVVLVVVQYQMLGLSPLLTVAAIVLSIPLALAAIRVTGDTNIAPVSPMGNMLQILFAGIAPGNISASMCASGMAGSIASTATDLQQDFRTAKELGTSPKRLAKYQFYGVFIGAICTAIFYPLLKAAYGIGEGGALKAPTAVKWKGFAELLAKGFDSLPTGCFTAFVVALIAGVIIEILAHKRYGKIKFLKGSTMGVGLGFLLPSYVMVSMALGGVLQLVLQWTAPKWTEKYSEVAASGLIAGESILAAILVPLLMILGWL